MREARATDPLTKKQKEKEKFQIVLQAFFFPSHKYVSLSDELMIE
jgi:hypothetical protein